jgi:hypothetical protein
MAILVVGVLIISSAIRVLDANDVAAVVVFVALQAGLL